jgi:hypothetical protein
LLFAAGGDGHEFLRIVDGDRVEFFVDGRWRGPVTVTGDGADLLRNWVRFGDTHLGVTADWLEDHPEFVKGLTEPEVGAVANMLRCCA